MTHLLPFYEGNSKSTSLIGVFPVRTTAVLMKMMAGTLGGHSSAINFLARF